MTDCRACTRPVSDAASICRFCVDEIHDALATKIPSLAEEYAIVAGRQTRYSERVGSRSTAHPLPFEPFAADLLAQLRNTLVGWIRVLVDDKITPDLPDDTIPSMCSWLLDHLDEIRMHEAAEEIHREITWWTEDDRWLPVDRPADAWYAGRCACDTELYAKPGSSKILCRGCGLEIKVAERREFLIKVAKDYLLTATEAADALGAWGMGVKPTRIRKWAERKRLVKRGTTLGLNGKELPTYRLGDIIDLLAVEAQRENEKRAS